MSEDCWQIAHLFIPRRVPAEVCYDPVRGKPDPGGVCGKPGRFDMPDFRVAFLLPRFIFLPYPWLT